MLLFVETYAFSTGYRSGFSDPMLYGTTVETTIGVTNKPSATADAVRDSLALQLILCRRSEIWIL